MKQQEIYELISAFEASSLTSLVIGQDSFHIELKREPAPVHITYPDRPRPAPSVKGDPTGVSVEDSEGESVYQGSALQAENGQQETGQYGGAQQEEKLQTVRSPIVGIYYAAPSPDEPPYVTVGQKVEQGQVLCLIEAMKMMNELKSPVSGIIRSAKGVNGELAEYDQILFEVEPC